MGSDFTSGKPETSPLYINYHTAKSGKDGGRSQFFMPTAGRKGPKRSGLPKQQRALDNHKELPAASGIQ
jgi:hypothetical protein